MMTEELLHEPLIDESASTACVIMFAHRIWKGLWFTDQNQAAGVIRGKFRNTTFRTGIANDSRLELIDNANENKYVILTLEPFRDMNQIQ